MKNETPLLDGDKTASLVTTREFAQALEAMVEAWNRSRSPELGELIEKLSPLVPRDPVVGKTRAKRFRQWQSIAETGDHADAHRLLQSCPAFGRRLYQAARSR